MFQHIHTHSILFTRTPSLEHKHTSSHSFSFTRKGTKPCQRTHFLSPFCYHMFTQAPTHMHTRTHTYMYTQKNWSSIISKPCDIDLDPLFLIEMRHCRWKGFGDKETIFGALEPVSRDENKSSSFTEMVFFRFNGRCDLWRLIDCR